MPKLAYRSPLDGVADPSGIVGISGRDIRIAKKPPSTMIELRGDPGHEAFTKAAAEVLGLALPTTPCTVSQANGWHALWSRPDGWLVIGPQAGGAVRLAALKAALAGTFHAAVDVSHRAVALELEGANARAVLAKGCPLDLHPSAFPAGRCARTILAGQPIFIHAVSNRPAYDLFINQSLAPALWLWLKQATRELVS